ncbi:hypothetical protein ACFYZB_15035 [Streptomyces sp. NPDC001852]|uniref:hypothetical protein n=1 Tax=Streptomyces sp. NPDC001852 TaxID=3364619 RepID=UPI00369D41F4
MTALPATVDRDILDHRILCAIKAIRKTLRCTIHEAIDVFAARFLLAPRCAPPEALDDVATGG